MKFIAIGVIISALLVVNWLLDKLYLGGALHLGSAEVIGWILMGTLVVTGIAYAVLQSEKQGK